MVVARFSSSFSLVTSAFLGLPRDFGAGSRAEVLVEVFAVAAFRVDLVGFGCSELGRSVVLLRVERVVGFTGSSTALFSFVGRSGSIGVTFSLRRGAAARGATVEAVDAVALVLGGIVSVVVGSLSNRHEVVRVLQEWFGSRGHAPYVQ